MTIRASDGWYRLHGDDGGAISQRAFPWPAFYWAYIKSGMPYAIAPMKDDKDLKNADPSDTLETALKIMDRDGLESVYSIIRRTVGRPLQCKWNGKLVGQTVSNIGISDETRTSLFYHENSQITEAIEQMRPLLRRRLQAWPYCGHGGTVELGGKIDRANKQIVGVWRCSCGE